MDTLPRSRSPFAPARLVALVASLAGGLAGCADRSAPPPRSSPVPEEIAALGTATPVFDELRAEPTWYAPESGRVMRLRAGVVEPVQDRTFVDETGAALAPEQLRVFDDGSIAMVAAGALRIHAADGTETIEDLASLEVALDGTGVDDLWYASWFLSDELGYRLCHRVSGATDCSVELPNVGGYTTALAVAADGSVYVTDRDRAVLRYAGGELATIGTVEGGVRAFRPAREGDAVLALADEGVLEIDAGGVRRIDDRYALDVVPTEHGYFVATYDSESVKVDPACRDGWLTSCPRRLLWGQLLVEEVREGSTFEIAHEDCDDAHPGICDRAFYGLGLDGGEVVVVGDPLRAIAE